MRNFTYFHCYADDLWEGYEKNGLLRDNFGIRFVETIRKPKELKFNELAKVDGKLYNYIKKHKCAFYVDRLQGGTFLQNYAYDMDLIKEYKRILGDKFLGFQMHEWLSNYMTDVKKKLDELSADEWTEENIKATIFKKFPFKNLFIEAMTVEELVATGKPLNSKQFYDNMTAIYKKRAKDFDLVPCDSYYMMFPFEAENGAKIIMPEVGSQTCDMRLQMCYARGVCKAYGLMLGAYYEPWGGDPFTTCSYRDDGKNEWHLTDVSDSAFVPGGPNGGSSRSLQFRVHLYAYLSGAEMISEEWGGYNTFKSKEGYELSEYGLVKKKFLDFVDKYPDIGEKISPIAVVVSNDLPCYTIDLYDHTRDFLFGYPLEGDELLKNRALHAGVKKIFSNASPMLGSEREVRALINSSVPDAVDMLNEGDGNALKNYRYLVNLTGDENFEKRYENCISPDEVASVLEEILPCKVKGGLHYLINEKDGGGYYLSVFNHSGVTRSREDGEKVLPEATATAEIEIKSGAPLKRLEGSENIELRDGKYYVTVDGGDWFFAEF